MKKHAIWIITLVVLCVLACSGKEAGCGFGIGSLIKQATGELKIKKEEQLKPTAPVIQVTPGILDFGVVTSWTSSDLSFTVKNAGIGTLNGSASGLAAPFSFVDTASYSLEAGQSINITVRFSPTGPGYCNGTVTFSGGGGASRGLIGQGT